MTSILYNNVVLENNVKTKCQSSCLGYKIVIIIFQIYIVILFFLGKLETKPWKMNINNMEYMVVCPLYKKFHCSSTYEMSSMIINRVGMKRQIKIAL